MSHDAKKGYSVSVGNWMLTLLLCQIPVVNLISLIIFAFASKSPTKRHWAIANLIWIAITVLILVALYFILRAQLPGIYEWVKTVVENNETLKAALLGNAQ